jgi:phosphohistidine phosphatase
VNDDDRTLTDEGVSKMRQAAQGLRILDFIPDVMLSSPLVRARQTAEILLEAFGKGARLEITGALAPAGSRREVYQAISSYDKINSVMLVGHQPSLGEIAGELVCQSPGEFIELKKGGACVIELKSVGTVPQGFLVALLTPSILRKIAG